VIEFRLAEYFAEDALPTRETGNLARAQVSILNVVKVAKLSICVARKKELLTVINVQGFRVKSLRNSLNGGKNMVKTLLRIKNYSRLLVWWSF
jgi:hypothetical protein